MKNSQKKVLKFHRVFGQHIEIIPRVPPPPVCELRVRLIQEELDEFKEACQQEDIEQYAKELADLAYVVLGSAVAAGFNLERVFDEVHRSNMTKVGGRLDPATGKWLKPDNYSRANVKRELEPWED